MSLLMTVLLRPLSAVVCRRSTSWLTGMLRTLPCYTNVGAGGNIVSLGLFKRCVHDINGQLAHCRLSPDELY
jgi:hypothetical protein